MSLGTFLQIDPTEPVVTLTADSADNIVVPESAHLFSAKFERSGPDLFLRNEGAPDLVVPGYFLSDEPSDLFDANGAMLRGDLVVRLAGPIAPGQYSELHSDAGAVPIGQVETLDGVATVQRADGVVETLSLGMKIFQQDVLETEQGGHLAVTFVDGTIFTLASGSRMVIDSLIYEPDSTENSGGFSLIQGGFVFIAGQVAKTGGIDVSTPSATMGIRGTTVVVEISSKDGIVTSEITLVEDIDGDIGHIELRDADGNLIANITETDKKWLVHAEDGGFREVTRDPQDELSDSILVAEAFTAYRVAASRVDAGDSFVTINDTSRAETEIDPGSDLEVDQDVDQDADASDEADIAPPPPVNDADQDPNTNTDTTQPFDDGFIQHQDAPGAAPEIINVQGYEDAANAIIGDAAQSAPAGRVFALAEGPQNGVATVDPNGTFSFVPNPDFNGTDRFTYTVSGPGGTVLQGTVVVEVLPVNDAPEAQDLAAVVLEDAVYAGEVDAADIDGDPLSFGVSGLPTFGEVLMSQHGKFTYTPYANFEGPDSFEVTITDPNGETALANVSITVQGQADRPTIETPSNEVERQVTEAEVAVVVGGQMEATDPDAGSSFEWSGSATGVYGSFVIAADGQWTYTLDPDLADVLAVGETAIESFTATVTDNEGLFQTITVPVTVMGTNDGPVAAKFAVFDTFAEADVSGVLQGVDVDTDAADLVFALGDVQPTDGTLVLNDDGSFTYTPDVGFVGIERFDYSVTDTSGETVTSQAAIAVVSDPQAAADQGLSVGVSTHASQDAPAGAVQISINEIEADAINLAIAMDRSSSIGAFQWNELVGTVRAAVETLGNQFYLSKSDVDVQIITFADDSDASPVYDLVDPALRRELTSANLEWTGGDIEWTSALERSADFFKTQPPAESNVLVFVSNGVPDTDDWTHARDELFNPTDGFDVTLNAFGFGAGFVDGRLDGLDVGAALLGDADELVASFGHSPSFAPRLIGFQIELMADGGDSVLLADDNSDALIGSGGQFYVPLASIENIADLLGDSNRINVTAEFDLNNDARDAEFVMFSSIELGIAEQAQTEIGLAGADLMLGSNMADVFAGGADADVILGFDGDDTLAGGSGADSIMAGGGDDVVIIVSAPVAGDVVDGGAGRDILEFEAVGEINAMIAALDISGIEALDIENNQEDALALSVDRLIDFSDTSDEDLQDLLDSALPNARTIVGEPGDSLLLDGQGAYSINFVGAVTTSDGASLDLYTFHTDGGNPLAALGVDSDIAVTTANFVTG